MGFFGNIYEKAKEKSENYMNDYYMYCDEFERFDLEKLERLLRNGSTASRSAKQMALMTVIKRKRAEE